MERMWDLELDKFDLVFCLEFISCVILGEFFNFFEFGFFYQLKGIVIVICRLLLFELSIGYIEGVG